jgi:hypothetical protein
VFEEPKYLGEILLAVVVAIAVAAFGAGFLVKWLFF